MLGSMLSFMKPQRDQTRTGTRNSKKSIADGPSGGLRTKIVGYFKSLSEKGPFLPGRETNICVARL